MTVTWLTGDALDVVRSLPDASVDLVATSPPFLQLRNYSGLPGQWGAESDPAAFLDHLLELTAELRRVMAPHGSIAVELGDTMSGSGGPGGDYSNGGMRAGQRQATGSAKARRNRGRDQAQGILPPDRRPGPSQRDNIDGWPLAKSLTGVPTLLSSSLAYGRNLLNPEHVIDPWRVRNLICWARTNPPVGREGDKFRRATSYITVATVSGDRWYDLDAVLTATGAPPLDYWTDTYDGDVWLITAKGSSLAHYAMWPAALAERLILSMCPAEVCRTCGEPRRRTALGWSDCGHNDYRPGVVLDPFAGTGTTLAVADIHGRDATGIDLDPANEALYPARYSECWRALRPDAGPSPVNEHGAQLDLLTSPNGGRPE